VTAEGSRPTVGGYAHVALAVRDLAAMIQMLEAFGFEVTKRKEIAGEGTSHLVTNGPATFDLLDSAGTSGMLAGFIERRGPGVHHVCLRVQSLDRALDISDKLGLRRADAEIREDQDGRLAFLHPSSTQGLLLGFFEPRG
jgi:methylmalonyl-CoA/ethylmalonyl-CoA epimerase